ncbi:hypothetical protein EIP86_009133 [Pleurotus ostreatoroseus]|nr:hypothetical protein EIP86_009133 [Pleurotus ostreatoroseus]
MFTQSARAQQQHSQPKSVRRGHKRRYNEGPGEDEDSRAPFPLSLSQPYPPTAHGAQLGHTLEHSDSMFRDEHHDQDPLAHESLGPARPDRTMQGYEQDCRSDAAWSTAKQGSGAHSASGSSSRSNGRDTIPFPSGQSQTYKKPRTIQDSFPLRPLQSSYSSRPTSSFSPGPQSYPLSAASDFAIFDPEVDPDSNDENDMHEDLAIRNVPYPLKSRSPQYTYTTFKVQGGQGDNEKAPDRPDRRSNGHRAQRQQAASDAQEAQEQRGNPQNANVRVRTYRRVNVLIDDKREGQGQMLAEVSVDVTKMGNPSRSFAEAFDIATELQTGPQRIDGPAKVLAFRGNLQQCWLRVGRYYDPSEPLNCGRQLLELQEQAGGKTLTLHAIVQEDSSLPPENCWNCGAPPRPNGQNGHNHTGAERSRSSRPRNREQTEIIRAQSRPRSRSEVSSPRHSHNGERPSSRPTEKASHSRRPPVPEFPGTPTSARSQAKPPAMVAQRSNPLPQQPPPPPQRHAQPTRSPQQPSSSSWLDNLASQAEHRRSPMSEDEEDDDLIDGEPDDSMYPGEIEILSSQTQTASTRGTPTTSSLRIPSGALTSPAFGTSSLGGSSGFGGFSFEKYSKQDASFAPPETQNVRLDFVAQPLESGPDKVIVDHLRALMKQDSHWATYAGYQGKTDVQFKELREVCYWVQEQVNRYVDQSFAQLVPGAEDVEITADHVYSAISFFPYKFRSLLDDLIAMDKIYGPGGEKEDPGVMEYLEETPSVTMDLSIPNYYHSILLLAHREILARTRP